MICPKMVTTTESEIICQQNMPVLDVKYHLRVASSPELSSSPPSLTVELTTVDVTRFESVVTCSTTIEGAIMVPESSPVVDFVPKIRSGSHTDIGPRKFMEDEHIQIDDLWTHLGSHSKCPPPSSFYAVFDGHGGPEAASFVKTNATRLFFDDYSELLQQQETGIGDNFFAKLEGFHRDAFVSADLAMADDPGVGDSCGTTALTALLVGNRLLVANAGDCRAVLCRRGVAVEMSRDHRPSLLPERRRVEETGGYINDGYLNGHLSVTRALGDWDVKKAPCGSSLIAEPEVRQVALTEDDEFMIIGCDGVWDVMTSQYAVSLVRRGLRRHDDPRQCAAELVREALRLDTGDNLTAIVVCFAEPSRVFEPAPARRSRFHRGCSLSEEAQNRLKSLLEGS